MPDSGLMVIRDKQHTRRDKAARIAKYHGKSDITAGIDIALDAMIVRIERKAARAKASEATK